MAKKVGKKPESKEGGVPPLVSLRQVYPTIARWASGYGWVEFGIDGRDRPFVRAEDEGGTVWEGEGRYGTLDEALVAMEAGLGEFLEEEGFNVGRGRAASGRGWTEWSVPSAPMMVVSSLASPLDRQLDSLGRDNRLLQRPPHDPKAARPHDGQREE